MKRQGDASMTHSGTNSPSARDHQSGLSIVELMVVLAVIVILAVVALPNLLNGRISANEASVIQTMRSIASAQTTVKQLNVIDNDVSPDGAGEFAYLAEMSGSALLRGGAIALSVPVLSGKMGVVRNGVVTSSGYHFQLYMPGPNGVGVAEDDAGGKADATEVDSDLAEQYWLCYAWPARRSSTGNRVYAINQVGDVMLTDNRGNNQGYSGLGTAPAFDAAFVVANDMTAEFAVDSVGTDGGDWKPVR